MHIARWGLAAGLLLSFATAEAGTIRGRLALAPNAAGAGGPADAVVYVDSLPQKLLRKYAPRPVTIRILQQSRRFAPRVTAVTVGTTVRFLNQDDVYHNVFSVSPAKRFDLGKSPPRAVGQVVFDRSGVVNLFCDIHPGMAAWVLVLRHRLYTRPDANGAFALPSLPPGTYTLQAWHPTLGSIQRSVEVPRRGDVTLNLSF